VAAVPFLKFNRDSRGYENTYLLHNFRRRSSGDAPRLLYWFRSPPHVRIGRSPLDEDAIRAIEDEYPDVEFDWQRILQAKIEMAPEPRKVGPPPAPPSHRDPIARTSPAPLRAEEPSTARATRPVLDAAREPERHPLNAGESMPESSLVATFTDDVASAAVDGIDPSELSAAERLLGAEALARLRSRHAEVHARITGRGLDAVQSDALRALAERLDPDTWVTESDVTQGIERFEATLEELRRALGPRRRRRGGRRRKKPAPQAATGSPPGEARDPQSSPEPARHFDDFGPEAGDDDGDSEEEDGRPDED
jgi:hypothetical protein